MVRLAVWLDVGKSKHILKKARKQRKVSICFKISNKFGEMYVLPFPSAMTLFHCRLMYVLIDLWYEQLLHLYKQHLCLKFTKMSHINKYFVSKQAVLYFMILCVECVPFLVWVSSAKGNGPDSLPLMSAGTLVELQNLSWIFFSLLYIISSLAGSLLCFDTW